jgi:hypothetical protein
MIFALNVKKFFRPIEIHEVTSQLADIAFERQIIETESRHHLILLDFSVFLEHRIQIKNRLAFRRFHLLFSFNIFEGDASQEL